MINNIKKLEINFMNIQIKLKIVKIKNISFGLSDKDLLDELT